MRVIPTTDLYDYLVAYKAACEKQKRSRAAQAIADFCNEQIAHFGLEAGASVTIIRGE